MVETHLVVHIIEILGVFLCAHHFYPKGVTYGDKEDWEIAHHKKQHTHHSSSSSSGSKSARHHQHHPHGNDDRRAGGNETVSRRASHRSSNGRRDERDEIHRDNEDRRRYSRTASPRY